MNRRLICIGLCLMILCGMAMSAAASEPLVLDYADLLTAREESALEDKADALRREYGMDVVILTLDTLDGVDIMTYAEDFYDENGYGYGSERSGTLLVISMEEREWYIDISGDAIFALTDYALIRQEEQILPHLQQGDYYAAFEAWMDELEDCFIAYEEGTPVDGIVADSDRQPGHDEVVYYNDGEQSSVNWTISVVVGLVISGITLFCMYSSMNTNRKQESAADYFKDDSYELKVHKDIFLYSNVTKTKRESNSGSSGGSGSSVHRSSSGRTHGGRGGKF